MSGPAGRTVAATLPRVRARRAAGAHGAATSLAALGVVFGDIGTSPLYTLKACFDFAHAKPGPHAVIGIASLLLYTLVLVVCVKYIGFIMRVDDHGEGGILALLARLTDAQEGRRVVAFSALTLVVVVGAAMLLGDGIITPAISVISAVEGIAVVSTAASPFVVPISCVVLAALFLVQSRGTERVGRLFGPVMLLWFVVIAVLGVGGILRAPRILAALDPRHAMGMLAGHGPLGLLVLGGVVLAVTGVEALYADLSHFGRAPIVRAWYVVVFPALICSYFGQCALLLGNPGALDTSAFYALAPSWATVPLVVVATAATIIASQALISGAFTLVKQAVALNLSPRVRVTHTSDRHEGQVFIGVVNIALAIGCLALVLVFRSSDRLSAAYGLAVSCTMLATSIAYSVVLVRVLHRSKAYAAVVLGCFVAIDGSFVFTGLPKLLDGGYVPIAIAAVVATIAVTWLEGRRCLFRELIAQNTPIDDVVRELAPSRVTDGTMIFLSADRGGVPFFASHTWIRDRAKQARLVLLTFKRVNRPHVADAERVVVEELGPAFFRITANVGYMELPRIAPIVSACVTAGLELSDSESSFFYSDPKIERALENPLPGWQRELYRILARNAHPLPDDLGVPAERRIELGLTVRI